MVIGQPFLHSFPATAYAPSNIVGWCFIVSSQLLGGDAFGSVQVGSSVKVTRKEMAMGLALKGLLGELESCRSKGMSTDEITRVEVVRTLEIPLDLHACRELRVLAHVFSGNQAELAAVVLRAALMDMQEHLDDDLDLLAESARRLMDDPCQQASEVI
jgi:hypothetical protein